ncbi:MULTISPECIES: hypothetical protein [Paenibacillus]|uniref:hypothetical protein n=1 Tax=Paenibacillus TaxID=44249 RepID=UPI0010592253|nr:hypothetical protein [Paenibacillus amylolyticus]TDL67971.1 hypothetical protein E2R58_01770 [Paenibacillus amylolyticus]UOK65281.1 hypothetical protein MT997_13610 [Paenibacillus sp. OVF10]
MLRKLSKSSLVLVLVTTLFASTALADASSEPVKYTAEEYVNYLNQLISEGDTEATETLEQFTNLGPSKQNAFLNFIASEDYVNAIGDMLSGKEGSLYEDKYKEISIEVETITTEDSQANQFSTNALAAQANQHASVSRSVKLAAFGIDTTTITLTVSWEHNGSVAVKPLQVIQGHTNKNPLYLLSETSNNSPGFISEGYFNASGTWTMRATGAAGFLSDTLGINIKASTPSHRYYSFTTSHSNMTPTNGWVAF